jgi:hypothetical protein
LATGIEPLGAIVDQLEAEYRAAVDRFSGKTGRAAG